MIPVSSLDTLTPGEYYLYALGLDQNGEVLGFDQSELLVADSPTAGFSGVPTQGSGPLTVQFTDLSSGDPAEWSWDFGDGTPNATLQDPLHVYTSSGTYTVTLTVRNEFGMSTERKNGYITVTGVPGLPDAFYGGAIVLGNPAPAGSTVSALVIGGSGSLVTTVPGLYGQVGANKPKLLVQGGVVSGSPITFYVNGVQALCRENGSAGPWLDSYPFENGGLTNLDLNVTSTAVTAEFTGSPRSGAPPLTVQFTDLSSGGPTQWNWNFGDGSGNSTEENPSHVYQNAGTYTVTLTVWNAYSTDTEQKVGYIVVSSGGLVANFQGIPNAGFVPLTVQFTDLSSGPHSYWTWAFGDGGSSNVANPSHTYQNTGSYTVTLTIRDLTGNQATDVKPGYITVSPTAASPHRGLLCKHHPGRRSPHRPVHRQLYR